MLEGVVRAMLWFELATSIFFFVACVIDMACAQYFCRKITSIQVLVMVIFLVLIIDCSVSLYKPDWDGVLAILFANLLLIYYAATTPSRE